MEKGQEKFFEFIMQNVAEENQSEAKKLLNESFSKLREGTFTQEYLMAFIPRMLSLVKPENVEQVKKIMMEFRP